MNYHTFDQQNTPNDFESPSASLKSPVTTQTAAPLVTPMGKKRKLASEMPSISPQKKSPKKQTRKKKDDTPSVMSQEEFFKDLEARGKFRQGY